MSHGRFLNTEKHVSVRMRVMLSERDPPLTLSRVCVCVCVKALAQKQTNRNYNLSAIYTGKEPRETTDTLIPLRRVM